MPDDEIGYAEAQRYEGGIIKYLFDKIVALEGATGGDETDIASIKETIGKASGDGAGGILKDVKDVKDAIGDSSSGLTKSVNDNAGAISNLETAIGDESTEGSILARIKALEDA